MWGKILRLLRSRFFILAILLVVQVALMVYIVLKAKVYGHLIAEALYVFSAVMVVFILSRDMHPSYKLAWIIPILLLPLFGGMFYLLFGTHAFRRKKLEEAITPFIEPEEVRPQDPDDAMALSLHSEDAYLQSKFIGAATQSPVYRRTQTRYFPSGESFFEQLKEDLRKAERYVFLEFFIVDYGTMLDQILEILEERARAGVEVRFMYDDVGSAACVSPNFPQELAARGIKGVPFNARGMKLSYTLNTRDHRKIVVIDGAVGYVGGANIADEYINAITRFGHWKDAFLRLEGEAVWSLAVIFLQMWGFVTDKREDDLQRFMPTYERQALFIDDGFVQPYADSCPISGIPAFKYSMFNAVQDAKNHVYIMTPYLIIDSETATALQVSASMGIDVRIITPGVPDKFYVHEVTRSNYLELLRAGVRIYEYTPGFIHSKTLLVDDKVAVVGTCNFDYRSFFLHFEVSAWMCGSSAIEGLKADFVRTFPQCKEITLEEMEATSVPRRLVRSTLSAFAPLM